MKTLLISNLIRDLDSLVKEIHTIYETKFKDYKLQKGQFAYITRVYENQGISLAELAYCLKLDKTTVTKAIQKLINLNFLTKVQDKTDKRIWHLHTTQHAEQMYKNIVEEKNRVINLCYTNFSEEEKKFFEKMLRRMIENINLEWEIINKKLYK